MKALKVSIGKDLHYDILIKNDIFSDFKNYIKANYSDKKIAIITDKKVLELHGSKMKEIMISLGVNYSFIPMEPGEESKNISVLLKIYEGLIKQKINRKDIIIAFGGGVVGDIAGFAASTYLRGIDYIQFPTTLLAQVDSSVGGKTALDLPWGKNLIGSFYHPKMVFIDPKLLKTLSQADLACGMAEVIKYACIRDRDMFNALFSYKGEKELLENIEHIIYTCCSIKKSVVEEDEKDHGERMLLNFGHTLGHAIEKYHNYKEYSHGQAVAIGMSEITQKSEALSITKSGTSEAIKDILKKYKLPNKLPLTDREGMLEIISIDKKSEGGFINLVLLKEIGKGMIKKFTMEEIKNLI